MKRFLNSVAAPLKQLKTDNGGNVAMMFAVSTFAVVGLLALAVDVSSTYFAKQRLQDTTDAIALLAAKDKSLDTNEKLTAAAQALYDATYPGNTGTRITINSITRDGDKISVNASNNIDTYFTGIFGRKSIDVGVNSSALYANRAMDVALVLDSTFSMSENNKINSLKSAATGLVDTFEDLDNENLRVSVVPFAQYVNVGLSRRNAPWLDVPADSSERGEEVCRMKRDVISRSNCRRVQRTCSNDGVSYDCSYTRCDNQYGTPYRSCSTPVSNMTWRGCVGSRTAGYDERVAFDGRRIPGLLNTRCATEIQPLSANMTTAKSTISALQARRSNGETYIPSGLLWGWRTLDESEPLSSTVGRNVTDRQKVMIVMTDGENKASKNGIRHTGANERAANDKTDAICEAAKRDDVTIYTIAYEVTDGTTQNMLNRCASDSSKFFNARNASELQSAFQQIGSSLNELRITS